jgi:hypothetical protein
MENKSVNILESPSDFTEMLSLSELNTQMHVLEFLQNNMLEYQRDYVRSFIKTKSEVLDFIPVSDVDSYFPKYRTYKDNQEFIVDTKNKELIEISKSFVDNFKFRHKDGNLICEYSHTNLIIKQDYGSRIPMEEIVYTKLIFDMGTNQLVDYEHRSGIYEPVDKERSFYRKIR